MDFNLKPPSLADLTFSDTTTAAMKADVKLGTKLASLARELHGLREASRAKQTELLGYYVEKTAGYTPGTALWMKVSREALEDPKTPAGVLLVAAKNVLGPAMAAWEPDTLRVELEDREKLKVPPVNYDKLMAAITLTEVPAFYFEVNTFSNTVMAFNHEAVDPEVVQEAHPAQICWAVYEAELIRHESMLWEPDFDSEPILYVAGVLHREGMVMAPPMLSFAQEALDGFGKGVGPSLEEVQSAWKALKKADLANQTFPEDAIGVQLAKLAACQVYLADCADKYSNALQQLTYGV